MSWGVGKGKRRDREVSPETKKDQNEKGSQEGLISSTMGAARNRPTSPKTKKMIPMKGTARKHTTILARGFLTG